MRTSDQGIRGTAVASIALAVLVAVIASGCGSSSSSTTSVAAGASGTPGASGSTAGAGPPASTLAPVHGKYSPAVDPSNFVTAIDNPYWPLKPGTTYHYKGVRGTTPQTDDETVTSQTKTIIGIPSVQVNDVVSEHGTPVERTRDYYAQDKWGNVWYMGEGTSELHHGHFTKASDSWVGGSGGAQPGIIMPGHPARGQQYRQEYYPGHAMDQARILGAGGPITVPNGSYRRTLMTDETAPTIDPGVHEHKLYVKGIGDVKEQTVTGNHEEIHLVSVTH
jgi:hypothetical protein